MQRYSYTHISMLCWIYDSVQNCGKWMRIGSFVNQSKGEEEHENTFEDEEFWESWNSLLVIRIDSCKTSNCGTCSSMVGNHLQSIGNIADTSSLAIDFDDLGFYEKVRGECGKGQ